MHPQSSASALEFWRYISFVAHFFSRVRVTEGCWLWTGGTSRAGYGQLGGKLKGAVQYTHRISYLIHHGPIPDGMYVCHTCDNRRCVNPAHLFLGTPDDNNRDMRQKGRGYNPPQRVGSAHALARLSEDTVRAIRTRYAAGGITQLALAEEYGVSWAHVSSIVRRRVWKHL